MGICGCVPLEPVQEIARSLVEQLKADEYCPYELRVSQCVVVVIVTIVGLIYIMYNIIHVQDMALKALCLEIDGDFV